MAERRFHLPILSILAVAVPLGFMAIRYRDPALWLGLQRDAATLRDGPWWRLASPLVINSAGWGQWAMVSLGFLASGAPLEERRGRGWWLALAGAGAIAGEIAAYLWAPSGGGASNALCGLLGGMAALAL
ncbi:MAG TPA: rhomboid family intramembrane serine protease, partial [Herpetosiphonaceae bacterium]